MIHSSVYDVAGNLSAIDIFTEPSTYVNIFPALTTGIATVPSISSTLATEATAIEEVFIPHNEVVFATGLISFEILVESITLITYFPAIFWRSTLVPRTHVTTPPPPRLIPVLVRIRPQSRPSERITSATVLPSSAQYLSSTFVLVLKRRRELSAANMIVPVPSAAVSTTSPSYRGIPTAPEIGVVLPLL